MGLEQVDDPSRAQVPAAEPELKRKRVRFSELHETKVFERDEENDQQGAEGGQLRTVLPGEDDLEDDERLYRAEHAGPVKDVDPEAAAKRRAAKRQQARALVTSSLACTTDVPEDLADAEEDDPREAVGWNEAGEPVPLEPFNLLREREEGYFDADMNYVEYRLQGLSDAWLEGLEQTAKVEDTAAAGKTKKRRRSSGGQAAQDPEQVAALDEEERAVYKRRIANVLQPGETVLQALRRLAKMGRGQQGQRQRGGGSRGAKTGGSRTQGADEGAEDDSDEDEGAGNVSTLLQQGHSGMRQRLKKILRQQQQQQEQQQQQQEQQQQSHAVDGVADPTATAATPIPASATVPPQLPSHGAASTCQEQGLDAAAAAATPAEGGLPAACGSAGAAEKGAALQPERPAVSSPKDPSAQPKPADSPLSLPMKRLGPSRRVPLENSVEFDKLTSYADILLGQCDFDIYNRTREQLLQEVAGSSGSALAAPAAVLGVEQQDAAAGVQASTSAAPVPAAGEGAADDQDMFGEDFEIQARQAELPGSNGNGEAAAAQAGMGASVSLSTAQQGGYHEPVQNPDQMMDMDPGCAASAADASTSAPDGGGDGSMQGFVLDPDSGLLYNSLLGYYFDPSRMVWRDAWTGLQYRMDEDGQYVKLSQEEQGCSVKAQGVSTGEG